MARPSGKPLVAAPAWTSLAATLLLLGGIGGGADAFQPLRPSALPAGASFSSCSSSPPSLLLASVAAGDGDASPPHTVQILMSDTGGGHRASANALRDALDTLYPNQFRCDIVDLYTDYGPFFPYDSYVPLYKVMAEYSFLWDWFYHFGATPFGLWLNEFCLEAFCFDPFKECLTRPTPLENRSGEEDKRGASGTTGRRADMVVSVHPLCQDIPLKILNEVDGGGSSRSEGRTTPFVTVVTDLGGAHPTWFNPGVDKCYVPSDALYSAATDRRVRPEQISQIGLPIRRGFWGPSGSASADKDEKKGILGMVFGDREDAKPAADGDLRRSLGLIPDVPTVLIVGGGDGMGGIVEQSRAVGERLASDGSGEADGPSYQMVVVCGNNAAAEQELSSTDWGAGVTVQVNGFVNNMDEYMRASDAIVTKAGPGTIAEASICGLPCVLSSYLPGQEAGNVPYVEENGFGAYEGDPAGIADTVSSWLKDTDLLAMMRAKALDAARPSATLDIARDIAALLFEHKGIKA